MAKNTWSRIMNHTCIYTVVNDEYSCFIPMFKYCAEKAYPEYDVRVKTVMGDGLWTATMRFLLCDNTLVKYDNVLITDVDVMLVREQPTFVYQHLNHMNANKLECYSNWDRGGKMSGVHFVTDQWWDRVKKATDYYLDLYKNGHAFVKDDDEAMLYDIIKRSDLPTSREPILWNIHGLHLGKFRNGKSPIQAGEDMVYHDLMHDKMFMDIVENNKCELVNRIFKNMKASF